MKLETIKPDDKKMIISFFSTEKELLYSFPNAKYPFTEDDFDEQVASRSNLIKVVNNVDEIQGFACLYDIEKNVSCYIGNVITNPRNRNAGVGTILIKGIIDIAKNNYNVKSILLNCWCENSRALLFYSKLGFKTHSLIEKTIQDSRIPILKMIKYT